MTAPRACLVDASIYIFRAWFSLPDRWHNDDGMPLNAVYGYAGFLLDFLQRIGNSGYCAAAFDESLGSGFRHEIDPGYKSSRELPDEALAFQLDSCRRLTEQLQIPCYGGERYEADDYLASLARLCREQQIPVTVVTRDKDLGQLVLAPGDDWWDFAADRRLDAAGITERFGVAPAQLADYLALVGDNVDDIPGVPGVGPKSAAALLQAFADLDHLEREMDSVASLSLRGAARIQQRLQEHWPRVRQSRQLTGLASDIPGLDELPAFQLQAPALHAAADFLQDTGINGPVVARYRKLAEDHPG